MLYGDGYAVGPAGVRLLTGGRLAGQVAVVTGGGSGIGAATARRLSAEGAAVALVGRRREFVEAVASGLGGRCLALAADAAEPGEVSSVVSAVSEQLGPVSILVANAGGEGGGTAADVTDQAWRHSMRANLDTCLVTARACLPGLLATRGCAVVVSSIAGLAASPGSVGYVTAKHALIGLTRSMARDFGPRGVRVNAVCPGWVRTPMADAEMDSLARMRELPGREDAYALATSQVPLRRPCTPEEVAAVIAFLASPDAAALTGVTLPVDAGATAVDLPTTAFDLA